MFFVYLIALFSTLLWINITVAEIVNNALLSHSFKHETDETNKQRSIVKTVLIIIMAIFWSIIFC